MPFKLAQMNGDKTVTVKTIPVAIILGAITVLPGVVDTLANKMFMTKAEAATAKVEAGKLDVERQQAAVAILQAALSDPDAINRDHLLELLVTAHVVDTALRDLTPEEIPQWPASPNKAP